MGCRCLKTRLSLSLIISLAIPYGYGIDLWNLTRDDVITFLKFSHPLPHPVQHAYTHKIDLGAFTTYCLGTLFVKLSILFFYLRINPDRTFRRLAYAIGAFGITYILISIGI